MQVNIIVSQKAMEILMGLSVAHRDFQISYQTSFRAGLTKAVPEMEKWGCLVPNQRPRLATILRSLRHCRRGTAHIEAWIETSARGSEPHPPYK